MGAETDLAAYFRAKNGRILLFQLAVSACAGFGTWGLLRWAETTTAISTLAEQLVVFASIGFATTVVGLTAGIGLLGTPRPSMWVMEIESPNPDLEQAAKAKVEHHLAPTYFSQVLLSWVISGVVQLSLAVYCILAIAFGGETQLIPSAVSWSHQIFVIVGASLAWMCLVTVVDALRNLFELGKAHQVAVKMGFWPDE